MIEAHEDQGPAMLVDSSAAAALGLAVGVAAFFLVGSPYGASAAALIAAIGVSKALQRFSSVPPFALQPFRLEAIYSPDELLLTLDRRVEAEVLLLDEPLRPSHGGPQIVQLFDGSPSVLLERIERHRDRSARPLESSARLIDDSAAFHQALAALKPASR